MHFTTWVFIMFSCIFGCSLSILSVHLGASHWNLELFWFTRLCFTLKSWVFLVHSNFVFRSPEKLKISVFSTVFVHQNNSRFQCSAPRFTDKTEVHNKKCKKTWWKLMLFNAFVFRAAQLILWAENGYKRTIFLYVCSVPCSKETKTKAA